MHEQKNLFHDFSNLLQKKEIPELLTHAETLSKPEQEEELDQFLNGFLHFLRTLLREKTAEKSLWLGSAITTEKIIALIEMTEQTQKRISRNVNKRLALESFFLSFI